MYRITLLLIILTISTNVYSGIIKTDFSDIELEASSTKIRLDSFFSHNGANVTVFGAIDPETFTSAGIGFISNGNFADQTSSQETVDIYFPNETIIWTFVDPLDINIKSTVRQLGFYYGSVQEQVTASFFDINDNFMESFILPQSIDGVSIGFDAGISSIHKIAFTQASNDAWVLGSFTQDTSINDIVFTSEKSSTTPIPVPEPSTLLIFCLAILVFIGKKYHSKIQ